MEDENDKEISRQGDEIDDVFGNHPDLIKPWIG